MRAGVTVGNDATRARVYDAMAARIVGGMTSREVSEANGNLAHYPRFRRETLTGK